MKRVFKIGIYVAFGVAALLVVLFLYIVSQLPSVAEIQQATTGHTRSSLLSANKTPNSAQKIVEDTSTEPPDALATNVERTDLAQPKSPPEVMKENFLKNVLNSNNKKLTVCENLSIAASKPAPNWQKDEALIKGIEQLMGDHSVRDPFIEPFANIIRLPLQRPLVKSVLTEALSLPGKPGSEYLNSIGFYAKVAAATADLLANKNYINEMADHSYHLFVISQIVNKKPDLAKDPAVQDFCHQIQNNISADQNVDVEEERAELLRLFQYADLKPEDINFDPRARMDLGVQSSDKSFSIGLANKRLE